MHTVPFRPFIEGDARSVLVRERVLDVGVPELALDEELLKCDLRDLVRALAQPVVGRHRVTPGASACSTARVDGGVACRIAVEASAADGPENQIRACNVGGGEE
jgi:hypothetical protein